MWPSPVKSRRLLDQVVPAENPLNSLFGSECACCVPLAISNKLVFMSRKGRQLAKMYLRKGEWCECERSFNTSAGEFEAGEGGNRRGHGAAFTKREQLFSGQRRKLLAGANTTWYLVTGDQVGTGADGEPLLKNVIPHRIVVWDGERFFRETRVLQSKVVNNHPGCPNCTCESIGDILA